MPTKTAKYTLKRSLEGQGGKLPEMETEPVLLEGPRHRQRVGST